MILNGLGRLAYEMLCDDVRTILDGNVMYDDEKLVRELEAEAKGENALKKMLPNDRYLTETVSEAASKLGVSLDRFLPIDEIKAMDAAVSRQTKGKLSLSELASEYPAAATVLVQGVLGHSPDWDKHADAEDWVKKKGHTKGFWGMVDAMRDAISGSSVIKATRLVIELSRAAGAGS